jgi:uncharacterized membrane protein
MLPPEKRFFVPFASMAAEVRSELFPAESSSSTGALGRPIVAIAAAVVTTVYVIASERGRALHEFYILGQGKAAEYPTDFFAGRAVLINGSQPRVQERHHTVEVRSPTRPSIRRQTLHGEQNGAYRRFSLDIPHNTTSKSRNSFSIERQTLTALNSSFSTRPSPQTPSGRG